MSRREAIKKVAGVSTLWVWCGAMLYWDSLVGDDALHWELVGVVAAITIMYGLHQLRLRTPMSKWLSAIKELPRWLQVQFLSPVAAVTGFHSAVPFETALLVAIFIMVGSIGVGFVEAALEMDNAQ